MAAGFPMVKRYYGSKEEMKPRNNEERQYIGLYTGHPEGGCSDVGVVHLDPSFVLITRVEYDRLIKQSAKLDTLTEAAKAIAEPRTVTLPPIKPKYFTRTKIKKAVNKVMSAKNQAKEGP